MTILEILAALIVFWIICAISNPERKAEREVRRGGKKMEKEINEYWESRGEEPPTAEYYINRLKENPDLLG